jgi:hypothetical protein
MPEQGQIFRPVPATRNNNFFRLSSRSPNNTHDQRDDGQNNQYMDQTAYAVDKYAEYPTNQQNNGYQIKKTTHKKSFKYSN